MTKITVMILCLTIGNLCAGTDAIQQIKNSYEKFYEQVEPAITENEKSSIIISLDERNKTIDLDNLPNTRFTSYIMNPWAPKESESEKTNKKTYTQVLKDRFSCISKKASKRLWEESKDILEDSDAIDESQKTHLRLMYYSYLIANEISKEFAKLWFTARVLDKSSNSTPDEKDLNEMLHSIVGMNITQDPDPRRRSHYEMERIRNIFLNY